MSLIQIDDGDRLARLEACYEVLRHSHLPLSDSDKVNIKSTLHQLRCLRIGWRSQLAEIYKKIEDPSWIQKVWPPSSNKSADDSRTEIDKLEETLRRFHFSLRLEARALEFIDDASASRIFLTTVDEEASRLEAIAKEIEEAWNSDKTREKRDQPTLIQIIRNTADSYREASRALEVIDATMALTHSTINSTGV